MARRGSGIKAMPHTYAVTVPIKMVFVIDADNPDIACAYAMTYANLDPAQIPKNCVSIDVAHDCAEVTEISNGE